MKIVNRLLILIAATGMLAISSCSKTADTTTGSTSTPATINSIVASPSLSGNPGDKVVFTISATKGTNQITELKIEEITAGASSSVILSDSTYKTPLDVIVRTYSYTIPMGATGTKDIKFTVYDKGGLNVTQTKTIAITSTQKSASFTAILFGAQASSTPSFFSSANQKLYKGDEAYMNSTLIDLCYYYDVTASAAIIAAPGDNMFSSSQLYYATAGDKRDPLNWSTRNLTTFKYNNIAVQLSYTNGELKSLWDNNTGSAKTRATDPTTGKASLSPGNSYIFYTAQGKYGVFQVSLQNFKTGNNGTIQIDGFISN